MSARILVIDDDTAFREMLCEALAAKDFEPVGVGTAEEGVARAREYGEAVGDVTYREAYDVMPFGNRLVTVSMTML